MADPILLFQEYKATNDPEVKRRLAEWMRANKGTVRGKAFDDLLAGMGKDQIGKTEGPTLKSRMTEGAGPTMPTAESMREGTKSVFGRMAADYALEPYASAASGLGEMAQRSTLPRQVGKFLSQQGDIAREQAEAIRGEPLPGMVPELAYQAVSGLGAMPAIHAKFQPLTSVATKALGKGLPASMAGAGATEYLSHIAGGQSDEDAVLAGAKAASMLGQVGAAAPLSPLRRAGTVALGQGGETLATGGSLAEAAAAAGIGAGFTVDGGQGGSGFKDAMRPEAAEKTAQKERFASLEKERVRQQKEAEQAAKEAEEQRQEAVKESLVGDVVTKLRGVPREVDPQQVQTVLEQHVAKTMGENGLPVTPEAVGEVLRRSIKAKEDADAVANHIEAERTKAEEKARKIAEREQKAAEKEAQKQQKLAEKMAPEPPDPAQVAAEKGHKVAQAAKASVPAKSRIKSATRGKGTKVAQLGARAANGDPEAAATLAKSTDPEIRAAVEEVTAPPPLPEGMVPPVEAPPEGGMNARPVEAGAEILARMTEGELVDAYQRAKAADDGLLVEVFGEDGAKAYRAARRKSESPFSAAADPEVKRADALIVEMESRLSEDQYNRFFGIGLRDADNVEVLKTYVDAHRSVAVGRTAAETGDELRYLVTRLDPSDPWSPEAVTLRETMRVAAEQGQDPNQIWQAALRGSAARFGEDADFMLRRFMRGENARPVEADSGSPPGGPNAVGGPRPGGPLGEPGPGVGPGGRGMGPEATVAGALPEAARPPGVEGPPQVGPEPRGVPELPEALREQPLPDIPKGVGAAAKAVGAEDAARINKHIDPEGLLNPTKKGIPSQQKAENYATMIRAVWNKPEARDLEIRATAETDYVPRLYRKSDGKLLSKAEENAIWEAGDPEAPSPSRPVPDNRKTIMNQWVVPLTRKLMRLSMPDGVRQHLRDFVASYEAQTGEAQSYLKQLLKDRAEDMGFKKGDIVEMVTALAPPNMPVWKNHLIINVLDQAKAGKTLDEALRNVHDPKSEYYDPRITRDAEVEFRSMENTNKLIETVREQAYMQDAGYDAIGLVTHPDWHPGNPEGAFYLPSLRSQERTPSAFSKIMASVLRKTGGGGIPTKAEQAHQKQREDDMHVVPYKSPGVEGGSPGPEGIAKRTFLRKADADAFRAQLKAKGVDSGYIPPRPFPVRMAEMTLRERPAEWLARGFIESEGLRTKAVVLTAFAKAAKEDYTVARDRVLGDMAGEDPMIAEPATAGLWKSKYVPVKEAIPMAEGLWDTNIDMKELSRHLIRKDLAETLQGAWSPKSPFESFVNMGGVEGFLKKGVTAWYLPRHPKQVLVENALQTFGDGGFPMLYAYQKEVPGLSYALVQTMKGKVPNGKSLGAQMLRALHLRDAGGKWTDGKATFPKGQKWLEAGIDEQIVKLLLIAEDAGFHRSTFVGAQLGGTKRIHGGAGGGRLGEIGGFERTFVDAAKEKVGRLPGAEKVFDLASNLELAYHAEDFFAKVHALKYHMEHGVSEAEAIARAKEFYMDFADIPDGARSGVAKMVPFLPSLYYNWQRIFAAHTWHFGKKHQQQFQIRMGLLAAGALGIPAAMRQAFFSDEEKRKLGRFKPGWFEVPIPIPGSDGKYLTFDLGKFIPMSELSNLFQKPRGGWVDLPKQTARNLTPMWTQFPQALFTGKDRWGSDLYSPETAGMTKAQILAKEAAKNYLPAMLGSYTLGAYDNAVKDAKLRKPWAAQLAPILPSRVVSKEVHPKMEKSLRKREIRGSQAAKGRARTEAAKERQDRETRALQKAYYRYLSGRDDEEEEE